MIRKLINENQINRVVVIWDGENSIRSRLKLYPTYKSGRDREMTDREMDNYQFQKVRVKEYLEELFIRQYITQDCEADDAIAYYVHNRKPDESILIATNDRDILQLLDENVHVYLFPKKLIITPGNFQMFFPYHYKNVKLIKIITGDKSDAIHGIYGLGSDSAIEKLVILVPAIREREVTLDEVFMACEEKKSDTMCQNILTGKSPKGIFGKEFYVVNEKLINLSNPLIENIDTDNVQLLINERLDPTDRRFKNLLRMMIKDGTVRLIPGQMERWEEFVLPFIKIIRQEKYN
jgi:5'-3' exonuclease